MTDPILFKDIRVMNEFSSKDINPMLRKIMVQESEVAYIDHGWLFFVTCIYRTQEEDKACGGTGHGLHTLWRAADVRTRSMPEAIVKQVAEKVNGRWAYDRKRSHLVALYEPSGTAHTTGPHLHFQTSPETEAI